MSAIRYSRISFKIPRRTIGPETRLGGLHGRPVEALVLLRRAGRIRPIMWAGIRDEERVGDVGAPDVGDMDIVRDVFPREVPFVVEAEFDSVLGPHEFRLDLSGGIDPQMNSYRRGIRKGHTRIARGIPESPRRNWQRRQRREASVTSLSPCCETPYCDWSLEVRSNVTSQTTRVGFVEENI